MADRPLVSVCMLAYQHEHYIAKAIDSVLCQKTNFPYELIIGEDCSSDNTRNICHEYVRRYPDCVRLIATDQNVSRGISGNYFRVCRACRGKYVAVCEGDDYWIDPEKLQKQVDYLNANPDCTLCFHPVIVHWEDGRKPDEVYPAAHRFEKRPPRIQDLLCDNVIQTNSVVYRWNPDGRLFDEFPLFELPGDWKLNLLHARTGKIGFLPDVMAVYRRHAGGLWQGSWGSREWFYRVGYRNALFYRWVQESFAVNRRAVLRRLVLATLAVGVQREELFSVYRPSRFWVYVAWAIAMLYGLAFKLMPSGRGDGVLRRATTWQIIWESRQKLLPLLTGMCYDLAIPLGSDRICSIVLRKAGLQQLSFPYDGVANGSLKWRTNLLCSGFQNWFELKDLKEVHNQNHNSMRMVVNTFTGFLHNLDFAPSVKMDEAYLGVCEKYKRRITRLFEMADGAKRILVVWICSPGSFSVTEEEIVAAHAKLVRRFSNAVVDLTVFSLSSKPFASRQVRMLNPQVKWIAYDYRNRQPVASQWAVDISGIAKLLRDCKVREYRSLREFGAWYDPRAVVRRVMAKVMSRGKERIDFLYRQRVWREPLVKIGGLQTLAAAVSELCLGSSHAHYGYLALEGCYNLGEISCDAYYSMQILRYWMPRLPQLRRVVYFYDIFTPGSVLDKSPEAFRRIPWLDRYGISPLIRDCREDTTSGDAYCRCEAAYKAYVHRGLCRMPKGYRGNAIRRCPMPGVVLEKRVATHLAQNKGDCDRYVNEMASLCREKDVELILVVPPLRADYLRFLPEGFRVMVPTGLKSLDFMYDKRFNADDFIDWDHLSAKGAAKLTGILHGEINGDSPEVQGSKSHG